MLAADEDAFFCDMAETYHILDWRALPLETAATLAWGLSPDSRVKMKLAGLKASFAEILLASIVDRLSLLVWGQTKDGTKGRNRPEFLADQLIEKEKAKSENVRSYDTPEAFEEARKMLMRGSE